jgi:hypothetical protein
VPSSSAARWASDNADESTLNVIFVVAVILGDPT